MMDSITISEKGDWFLCRLSQVVLIDKPKWDNLHKFHVLTFSIDGLEPVSIWNRVGSYVKPLSRLGTFVSAATGECFFKPGDSFDLNELIDVDVLGLYGPQRQVDGKFKDSLLRFLPYVVE